MLDGLSAIETGLERLVALTHATPWELEVLVYQARLMENIRNTRALGDNENGRHTRAEIVQNLNRLALACIGRSFNELVDEYPAQGALHRGETLPPAPHVFLGRQDEIAEFEKAVDALVQGSRQGGARRVFLIRGEGGMGKSTLFRKFADICSAHGDRLYWVYIDWELENVDSTAGTPYMMKILVDSLEAKYGVSLPGFRQAWARGDERSADVARLRAEFTGQSPEAFERFLQERLPADELAFYRAKQHHLSVQLVNDLKLIARTRPLAFLFDTYEVAWRFADDWLRRGLIQFSLIDHELGETVLFAIAGRLPERPLEVDYRDDIARFTGNPRALYHKSLDRFTPSDVVAYFAQHPEVRQTISLDTANIISNLTLGIPLAVSLVAKMVTSAEEANRLLSTFERSDAERDVIDSMIRRFFRHLQTQPQATYARDRDCIYALALMRESEREDWMRQTQLLSETWRRLNLIPTSEDFWPTLDTLRRKYSFFFDAGTMHPDVRFFIRRALQEGPARMDCGRMLEICQESARISHLRLGQRLQELNKSYGDERAATEKYRDSSWQHWLLDQVNYQLWLQEYDLAVESIIEHYVMGLQYDNNSFHQRLVALVARASVFYDVLPPQHRGVIDRLVNLKEWIGRAGLDAERTAMLGLLRGEAQIEARLLAVRAAIDKGSFGIAEAELGYAEEAYRTWGTSNIRLEARLGESYHLLARRLGRSSKRSAVQQKSLGLLQKARGWAPDNPHIHCALGNTLVSLWRLEEAKLEYEWVMTKAVHGAAHQRATKEAAFGLERVKQLSGSRHYSREKQARLLTASANGLSALGEFDQADKLFRRAVSTWPEYVPAGVKLCHLLRQQGRIDDAFKLLQKIQERQTTVLQWRAMALDAYGALYSAVEDWNAALDAYRQAVAIAPEYINAHNGLGKLYLRQRQPELAVATLEVAWKVKMRSRMPIRASLSWVLNNMGMAYLDLGQRSGAQDSFERAETLCSRHLEKESRQYQLWSELAVAQMGQGHYEEARESLERLKGFGNMRQVPGFLRELSKDIELIGAQSADTEWHTLRDVIDRLY